MKVTPTINIVAIVQARMGSTRLPGKALLEIAGMPMLFRVLNRLARSKLIAEIVVATTKSVADDELVKACDERGVESFRGSENDVLDRYFEAARKYNADVVVRITSDCPLIDSLIVDQVIDKYMQNHESVDYVSNVLEPRTFPRGLDIEVFSNLALARAWEEDSNSQFREHVTQYFLRNPDKFRLMGIFNDIDLSYMRWTVDTPEDLEFVRTVYDQFENDLFTWIELVTLLKRKPELLTINQHVKQKHIY